MGFASMLGLKRTKPLVLHVDDSPLIIETTKAMLFQLGCDSLTALSGEECVKLAEEQKPDLILVDAMMPQMDGFATTLALRQRENTRTIPVIMLTGTDRVKDVDKARESGANGYLVKPLHMDRLESKLREFIALPPRG
ncbi:MAG: response regulator [Elusimicrobia bacterium]|nr:response regulator [Elusimicrobiota bacterium]